MREAVQLAKWLESWARRLDKKAAACGLATCARSGSRWRRLWGNGGGAWLQGTFYCTRQCLETALTAQLARLHALPPPAPPANRIPLGLLMVARGWLTHDQVTAALHAQQQARTGQIGDWFERLGFATEQQVTSALGLQWGCPVTHSMEPAASLPFGQIPLGIMESLQMIPLNFVSSTSTLYLAFGQRVDHAALFAIEKLLDCRTQACVASRRIIAGELATLRQQPRPREFEFGPMHDLAEIGRVGVSYMVRLGADEARLARVADFIWLRLRVATSFTDLLFRSELKGERKQFSGPRPQFSEKPVTALKLRTGN